jgi:hypothetical protein
MASWSQTDAVGGQQAQRQVEPHPRPPKREKASRDRWDEIRAGFEHATCVSCGLAVQSLHHCVPKSQGGDDVAENMIPMCGDGTRGCHGILESHAPGWERVAAAVRVYVLTNRPRCVYVIGKIGWDRFNSRYPLLSGSEQESPPEYRGATANPRSAGEANILGSSGPRSDPESDEVWRYRPSEDEPGESFAVERYE